jgi:hypothetical protein
LSTKNFAIESYFVVLGSLFQRSHIFTHEYMACLAGVGADPHVLQVTVR